MPLWIVSEILATEKRVMLATKRNSSHRVPAKDLRTFMEAGMHYRETRQFEAARRIFEQIQFLDPDEPLAEIGLGSVCFSEGQFAAAAVHYRRALYLSPRNAYAYALLGESQIFQSEFAGARVSLRRAVEIDPRGSYGQLANGLLRFMQFLPGYEASNEDRPS
jgi:Flp pilus assembly protein TadD